MKKQTRLEKAEEVFCAALHKWLTNPANEDLPDEIVKTNIDAAFDSFIKELVFDEDECAEFIAAGGRLNELDYLKIVFEYYKSRKICDAIKENCEIAFSHKYSTESRDMESSRRQLIEYMENCLADGR